MNRRTAGLLAWSIALVCFAMAVASLVLLYLDLSAIGSVGAGAVGNLIPPVTIGALGALVASRRPENPLGWMLLGIAASVGISALTDQVGIHALLAGVSVHGWVRWMAWAQYSIGHAGLGLGLLILVLLLFPDGRPLSRRWRWVAWVTVVISIGFAAGAALDPTPVQLSARLPSLGNPVGVPAVAGFSNSPAFLVMVLLLLLAVVALLLRLRRSHGDERQQLKWFAYAAGVSVGLLIVAILLISLSQTLSNVAFSTAFSLGFAILLPGAAALAILRYGLYEIDVVINKTVVYGTLAVFITLVYVGLVVGVGTLVGHRGSPLLSAIAAAVIAVAFQPVRERSRRFANRVVYGKRATPYEVLSDFAERMAGTYSVEEVLPRTARMLAEGTGAVRADVWLLVESELRPEGSWPATQTQRIPLADDGSIEVPDAARVVPVRYQGELLGALSVHKAPGDPITPTDEKLLADVASQAGLVLRNVRLIEELRASRQRIVAAQDEERRKIERNIHDGAQQQLVALAVKLNLAGALVGKNSKKERAIIDQLKAEAADALENLRDLARGIYPPLLADQGLVAALQSQARKSPVPVSVEADGIARFSQDTEAAVYFCTLEALQNVAKYANASNASVELAERGDALTFTVRDDGVGFDPSTTGYGTGMQGMADRLAALGGELRVTSAPGDGTLIEGSVPIDQVATLAAP